MKYCKYEEARGKAPTIEIGPKVAVVSFHKLLYCWQELRVVPFSPVVRGEHATTDKKKKNTEKAITGGNYKGYSKHRKIS